jgi:subtilisin family serine protease
MCLSKSLIVGLTFALAAGAAQAQIGLPSARLPGLPGVGAPAGGVGLPAGIDTTIDRTASRLGGAADVQQLAALRRQRIAALIRAYPRVTELDPRGNAIVRGALVAYAPSEAALDRARAAGFAIVSDRSLGGLGARVVVLRAPDRLTTRRALDALRALDRAGTYDFDHLYSESGKPDSTQTQRGTAARDSAPGVAGSAQDGSFETRIGLIDSGVDIHHPVFDDVPVHLHGCGGAPVPAEHGTEVASLLTGRSTRFRGAAAGAALFAADVYCGAPTGGAIDAIAEAFDWLAQQRVPVINVSLVGPPNALLAAIVHSLTARGYLIVAAVGNDGPAAPPLYPAAYPGVIGVTGVDAHRHVLMEAERGAQVMFAAPGADMSAALPPRGFAEVRGTSFAAPIVAGLLAPAIAAPDPATAARALESLERRAIDLGARGVDPVYGYGLVGADLRPEPALARSQ